jgi:hypothetical protein
MGCAREREADAGAHLSGRATADGVDHEKSRAGPGESCVDFFGGASFFDSGADEFFAHRDHHEFWIQVGTSGKGVAWFHSTVNAVI